VTGDATPLITLEEALHLDRRQNIVYHRRHLNPRYVTLLKLVDLDRLFVRASGVHVWDSDGNQYVDFLGGFAALSVGYNHPRICAAIDKVGEWPNLVEGLNVLAGALAHNLAVLTQSELQRVYFANSGAEVVDAAIKLARAATGRKKLVACHKGFHGRTIGALSVMDRPEYHDPFVPLLTDVAFVPFGDSEALEAVLRRRDVAGFIVEPIQGEAGIIVPPEGYLRAARELCTRYGTLLIADEIQTGLGRTGKMFAVEYEDVVPDVLLLGKVLGGGVMPLSALLTTDDLWRASKGGTDRSPFHTPTFGGNTHACAAGLATLEVLVTERLSERAAASGAYLLDQLRALQRRQPLIAEVRGRGLMIGIEFTPATRGLLTLMTGGLINRLSRTFLTGMIIKRLLVKHRIVTSFTLNDLNVLRLQPPLNIERGHLDHVVESLEEVLENLRSFSWAAMRHVPDLIRVRLG
jgi:putrescine aminotransferase